MTIAAGFVVENGIVLCADSQETVGDYKFPVEKVVARRILDLDRDLEIAVAGSGLGPLVDMAAQRIVRAAEKHQNLYSYEEFEGLIGEILNELYGREFALYPLNQKEDAIIDLLIAVKIRHPHDSTIDPVLFYTNATAISRTSDYRIIGAGRAVQNQIRPLFSKFMPVWRASLLAMYLLSIGKSVLTSIGGNSRIVTIQRLKSMGVATPFETQEAEKLFGTLSAEWRFILDIADVESSDAVFDSQLTAFTKRIQETRYKFKANAEQWKALINALAPKTIEE